MASKPRPPAMFQHPQTLKAAPLRDKLLFIEAIAAAGDLTQREMRLATLLVSYYSHADGDAHPSLQHMADALGIQKRNVSTAVQSLVRKGWFFVLPGRPGRGEGNANRYIPNPEKVPSAVPLQDAAAARVRRRQSTKRSRFEHAKGPDPCTKKVPPAGPDPFIDPIKEDPGVLSDSALGQAQGDPREDLAPNREHIPQLRRIAQLLPSYQPGGLTSAQRETVEDWRDACYDIADERDLDDDVRGWALRLARNCQTVLDLDWSAKHERRTAAP